MALSNKIDQGWIFYHDRNLGAGYLLQNDRENHENCQNTHKSLVKMHCAAIQIKTLDSVIPAQKIDLLKMDAEGSEPFILEGAQRLLKENPNLILMIEWAPANLVRNKVNIVEFVGTLKHHGFRCWLVNRKGSLDEIPIDLLGGFLGAADIVLSTKPVI